MNRVAVRYEGEKVGLLAEARGGILFEYDRGFIQTGHELSPLNLTLGPGVRSRDASPGMRLHGLFEDSLPDAWGERLMLEWFRKRGTPAHDVTPLMMLSYVGRRGMGALMYEPEMDEASSTTLVSLAALHEAALEMDRGGRVDLAVLAEVGSSAGGKYPKALIGMPRGGTGDMLAGAGALPPSHDAWLVKLDTTRDGTSGPLEQAYALMARAAGIDVSPSRLLETRHGKSKRYHFAVKRFDREGAERIHHHTLAGLTHVGGSDLSYETFLRVTRRITLDERDVWRAYRRAAFNVLASNRDDHGKNHGFLYRNREWKLGPAYDLTFRSVRQLPERGMSIGGERALAGRPHLLRLAESEALDIPQAKAVIDEVAAALARWKEFADEARVPARIAEDVDFALSTGAR